MLRTRLVVGTILAALAAGMLLYDEKLAPGYPFLFATIVFLAILGTLELLALLPAHHRPSRSFAILGVVALIVCAFARASEFQWPGPLSKSMDAAEWVFHGFSALFLIAFLCEMAVFGGPGQALPRLAFTLLIFTYLGVLPSFLAMLRTNRGSAEVDLHRGTIALALAIFVPKGCDIGAYFTGRLFGRHKMTPLLSPKKTWEGAAGGLATAVGVAFALNQIEPVIPHGLVGRVLFGLSVGIAGMLGDLAESMIKRDCERKDASEMVPGFGGVLDVVDSILFAAPLVYWWLR